MPAVEVEYSRKFLRNLQKLDAKIREKAGSREEIFMADPFDPRLETHKLHGKDLGYWAYSVDRRYRIKFLFLSDRCVLYLDIGTHDIYS